ncbi:hypothetical protein BVRB_2g031170 [Beta vulgaris subsp. vulgaris]|uniref:uncharacterized protein At2g39795, mitochondrial n=1 Tax=Beta vulgaris subsp. vulgaris TaxID=3555 RepID=UPI00053F2FAE|nr:uncharacterized protein At2g39795, mitochondrial [Beta vulgaris subsp. vulgaris]XP_048495144.1 uncharacterized protein At2g39795, mitochondrial [Beta vulgaris subsp. vulgaris]XP_048495145.1 uncharacterized protein At2g39795, mitochondrial [Beta vulgaris subsp. vulgaris]KMT19021.1 hypothetical protein BVRB_2g031170 [Beta vulgaris subsp. vulgaris]
MATFFKFSRKWLPSPFSLSSNLSHRLRLPLLQTFRFTPESPTQIRTHFSESKVRSPFDSNIIRILRNEVEYQNEYAPPHEPSATFNSFSVEDRPGEQFVRLRHKFSEKEDIKLEATMFDGCVSEPKAGDDADGEDIRLHISLLVDISKGEGSDGLGFVCSAWPDGLEIMKVYMLRENKLLPKAHMGPNTRNLNPKLRKALHEYLEARGVNAELSVFLHQYMVNKDRTELLRWLETVKSFVEM